MALRVMVSSSQSSMKRAEKDNRYRKEASNYRGSKYSIMSGEIFMSQETEVTKNIITSYCCAQSYGSKLIREYSIGSEHPNQPFGMIEFECVSEIIIGYFYDGK
jgi:hypothetical protein